MKNAHPNFNRLFLLASKSHETGRNPDKIGSDDIDLARLYSYAFRRHVIGVFNATRVLLEARPRSTEQSALLRMRACELLEDLANMAIEPIPVDFTALLATFYRYANNIKRAEAAMNEDASCSQDPEVLRITKRFINVVNRVRSSNGIELTRDTEAPEQATFVVPNLGITIVPLVYGDYHSWNLAWLDGDRSDVPYHRHSNGVEIHLGYSPIRGHIVLDNYRALTNEGYALAIPPNTRHGYVNASEKTHHLPFIFGSYKRGGWGVFFDVEAQPIQLKTLRKVPSDSNRLNTPIRLERIIRNFACQSLCKRKRILPACRTNRNGTGGLELHLTRAPIGKPYLLRSNRFLATSVVSGSGLLRMAGQECPIVLHDHFGIPGGIPAEIEGDEKGPLVLMDADLVPETI